MVLVSRPEFSRPKLGRKGYNSKEVDDFVDLVIAKLKGRAAGAAITEKDLGMMVFHDERGGAAYDSDEVDGWLQRMRPRVRDSDAMVREEDLPEDREGSVVDMAAPPHFADRFPRVSRSVLGLAIDDVDRAMDHLREHLVGPNPPSGAQILSISFREQPGGYRPKAVAAALELIAIARDAT